MNKKTIAYYTYSAYKKGQKRLKNQTGLTLIELMVAMALGLLIVGVATVAMLGTRNVTSSVGDLSGIQQQAAYVMRLFGNQLRQAGSLYLDLGLNDDGEGDIEANTAFQLRGNTDTAITENSTVGTITIRFTGYQEPTFANAGPLSRNCLAAPASITAGTTATIESIFSLSGTDLRCQGNGANAQPIAQNVASFQVRYLLQSNDAANPTMLYTNAAGVGTNWNRVQGVEVCLVLFGTDPIDLPAGTSYTNCDGTAVNMTTLTGTRRNRMHYVFRNVFQLRSQGLI